MSDLPTAIDVGGEIYDLQTETNAYLSHKGRKSFEQTFVRQSPLPAEQVEYLLRKYLPIGKDPEVVVFSNDKEKKETISILERRAKQLESSKEMSGSYVRNIPFERYLIRIRELIDIWKKGGKGPKKVTLPTLSENQIFALLLELGWYMAHPSEVPAQVEQDWGMLLEKMENHRLGDIVDAIRAVEAEQGLPTKEPLAYFKAIEMKNTLDQRTLEDVERKVKHDVVVNAQPIRPDVKKRLSDLTQILHLKQYVEETDEKDESGIPIVSAPRLHRSLLSNPMKNVMEVSADGKTVGGAGATNELTAPLGQAMMPLFTYMKRLYDPVYDMLDKMSKPSLKRSVLPHLLLLLHLCNEFYDPVAEKPEEGFYHLKNLSARVVEMLTEHLEKTRDHMETFPEMGQRDALRSQIFHLPKARVRSLIRNNGGMPVMSNMNAMPTLQFFVVGVNLLIPSEEEMRQKAPQVDSKVHGTLEKALKEGDVFLAYSSTPDSLPLHFFEVDMSAIRTSERGLRIHPLSEETEGLRKYLKEEDTAEKVLKVEPHTVYTDGELVLSTWMCLKERMPQ